MAIPVLMPALSPTMTEGKLATWMVAEGDKISAGDVIAEIETDKATMEVEAVDEGTLGKIIVAAGTDNVAVNAPIAVILEEGEDAGSVDMDAVAGSGGPAPKAEAKPEPAPEPAPAAAPAPAAKKRHRRRNLHRLQPHRRANACSPARSPAVWRSRQGSISDRSRAPVRMAGS